MENLTLQSPQFDQITKESGVATRDGVKLLWTALNYEMAQRRRSTTITQDRIAPKVFSAAPTASQNNYDLVGASLLLLTGSSAVNITGIKAPSFGEAQVLIIHNIGSATITVVHNSGSSDAENRIRTQSGANVSVTTDKSMILLYLNSLWRELKLA